VYDVKQFVEVTVGIVYWAKMLCFFKERVRRKNELRRMDSGWRDNGVLCILLKITGALYL